MKRFKSTTGEEVRIALTNGHVFLVGNEWKDLPEFAYSAAYSQCCVSEDMITGQGNIAVTTEVMAKMDNIALAKQSIKDVLTVAMETGDGSMFNKNNGTPKVSAVSSAMGSTANAQLVKEVWYIMLEEAADKDDA